MKTQCAIWRNSSNASMNEQEPDMRTIGQLAFAYKAPAAWLLYPKTTASMMIVRITARINSRQHALLLACL